MQNIFAHSDYRSFLWSYYENQKSSTWNYGVWAKELKLKDNSSINKIIRGQRHPGPELVQRLSTYFKFKKNEEEYFEKLVDLAKAQKNPKRSLDILIELKKLSPKSSFEILDEKEFKILSHWIYLTIRQMVKLKNFVPDPEVICKRLKFKTTPQKVKEAIELLLEKGFLTKSASGKLTLKNGPIKTEDGIVSEAIKKYHIGSMKNAAISLYKDDISEREFGSLSLCISKHDLPRAKEHLQKILKEFSALFDCQSADQVYQLQHQFFPLTKLETINEN